MWERNVDAKVLAELVANVVKTGNHQSLSKEKSSTYHQQLELEVADAIESMRLDKRKAYEDLKNIAIR